MGRRTRATCRRTSSSCTTRSHRRPALDQQGGDLPRSWPGSSPADDDLRRAAHAAAPEPRPDRRRAGLPGSAEQHRRRQHGRRDGAQVVPVRSPRSLSSSSSRTSSASSRCRPTPTDWITLFGTHIPNFSLYAATANLSIPLVLALVVFISYTAEGIRARGRSATSRASIPAGVDGADGGDSSSPLEVALEHDAAALALDSSVRQHPRRPPDHPVHGRRRWRCCSASRDSAGSRCRSAS